MIKNKEMRVFPIDNTKRFICAIFETNINDEILKIFLHPVEKFHNQCVPKILNIPYWYETNLKRLKSINDHIKNMKYEFVICDENGNIKITDAHLIEEYKNITHFELVTFTKQLSLVTLSKTIINSKIKNERIIKQSEIDKIKKSLILEDLNAEKIQQLQSILGLN